MGHGYWRWPVVIIGTCPAQRVTKAPPLREMTSMRHRFLSNNHRQMHRAMRDGQRFLQAFPCTILGFVPAPHFGPTGKHAKISIYMRAIGRENLLRCGIVKNPPLPLTVAYERQQNDAPDPMDHIIFLDINVDERNSRCLRAYLSAFDDSLMIVGGRDLEILWLFSKAVVVVFHTRNNHRVDGILSVSPRDG